MEDEYIIGKYKVICKTKANQTHTIVTDNPLEAVQEANRFPDSTIINVCGEKEIYEEKGIWKVRKS